MHIFLDILVKLVAAALGCFLGGTIFIFMLPYVIGVLVRGL